MNMLSRQIQIPYIYNCLPEPATRVYPKDPKLPLLVKNMQTFGEKHRPESKNIVADHP